MTLAINTTDAFATGKISNTAIGGSRAIKASLLTLRES